MKVLIGSLAHGGTRYAKGEVVDLPADAFDSLVRAKMVSPPCSPAAVELAEIGTEKPIIRPTKTAKTTAPAPAKPTQSDERQGGQGP